jgi:hypothetical protein
MRDCRLKSVVAGLRRVAAHRTALTPMSAGFRGNR